MCAESGSASLVAVAMIAALFAVSLAGAYLGCAVVARHRAQAAADLAALAAASHLVRGAEAACAYASTVAQVMQTTIGGCTVDDLDVVVTVDVAIALGRLAVGPAHAAARAGPAGAAG